MTISALLSNCLLALTSSIESLIACWLVLLITPLVAYLVYRSLLSLTRWLAFAKTDDDDDDDSDSDSGEHSTCCNKMIRLLSSKGKSGSQEGGAAGTPTSPTASTETNTGSSVGGGGAKITSKQTTTHFEGKGSKCNGKVMDFNYGDIDFDCQASVDLHTMERLPKYYIEHGHFMTHLHDDARSLIEAFERGHRINPQGNCLGRIDLAEKKVIYSNYATVYERIKNFGNGLYSLLNGTRQSQQQLLPQTVAIYSGNCSEFIVAEYGCYYHSFVVVPVYDTLGPNICSFIVNQAEIECIVCDRLERVQVVLSQENTYRSLRYIVVFNDIPQSYKVKAMSNGLKVFTMDEIEQIGAHNPSEPHRPSVDKLAVICYTSGTTGTPKGVMLSHGNVIANVSAVMYQMLEHTIRLEDVMISYLPLAHMFERCCQSALYMVGGSVVFFSGDIKALSNDMKIAQPTLLPAVPRLLTRIYCKIMDSVKGSVVKNFLLNTACYFKQKQFDRKMIRNDTIWDKIIFRKIRDNFGGHLRLIMCGSAPLNPNVLDFLRCTLGCVILEGYGQTEVVAPCTVNFPGDFNSGSVGPPLAAAAIKLIDVPEMGYLAAENRGEILVRGPILFQGYFKDEQRTKETIDEDGWLHTGDIGEFEANGTLRIVDRKNNMFKLSQGEYIAPEKIENTYAQCSLVAQMFVYGESLKSSLVGIVVPDKVALETWAQANNISGDYSQDVCRNAEVKKMLLRELHMLGVQDGLKSFEQVKDIYVHPELLSIESGLITPTLKSKRKEIFNHFKKEIDEIYSRFD